MNGMIGRRLTDLDYQIDDIHQDLRELVETDAPNDVFANTARELERLVNWRVAIIEEFTKL